MLLLCSRNSKFQILNNRKMCRNGSNGSANGTPKDSAAAFLSGFIFSLILPIAGIGYFIFRRSQGADLIGDSSGDDEQTLLHDIARAIEQEL